MLPNRLNFQNALQDFNEARAKASFQEILAHLTGKSNELLSYDEVAEKLRLNVRTEGGVHDIPISGIVGSVNRSMDFTRDFLPRKAGDKERWARVKEAYDDPIGTGLPPIEVYKVGDVYFVLDGNHRVSIARQEGAKYIEAHVIEVKSDVPITPEVQPEDLILKSEYADFLEKTDFARLRPGADFSMSVCCQYDKLFEHIQVHRYFMGIDFKREIDLPEAVGHWYDTVYLSIVQPIRERGLLRWFPGRTETDLYLWVSEHRAQLQKELGWEIRPDTAVEDLAVQKNADTGLEDTGSWRLAKMFDRYTDRLFRDILVSITGSQESWAALEQAIVIAQKEGSTLHGLHVNPDRRINRAGEAQDLQARFNQRCAEAGVKGSLVVEQGAIAQVVCNRALLTDLVILNVAHPPLPGLSGLNSGLRSIIRRSARPILALHGKASPLDRILLAFDGSPKSKEALFVAAYLAEKWGTSLTVLTAAKSVSAAAQEYAQTYLDLHELKAEFIVKAGSRESTAQTIRDIQPSLILMGSYSGTTVKEILIGSMVNTLLRSSDCPLLICR